MSVSVFQNLHLEDRIIRVQRTTWDRGQVLSKQGRGCCFLHPCNGPEPTGQGQPGSTHHFHRIEVCVTGQCPGDCLTPFHFSRWSFLQLRKNTDDESNTEQMPGGRTVRAELKRQSSVRSRPPKIVQRLRLGHRNEGSHLSVTQEELKE